jgi:primary-amine oxidase
VKAEIEALDLPDEAVVCVEIWSYATDGMRDMSNRIVLCFFYMRMGNHRDSNHYAYPLDIMAEMNGEDRTVTNVFTLPSAESDRMKLGAIKKFDRKKLHTTSEYHPDKVDFEHRTTTKPLRVVQPEGPSFSVKGNLLVWEKWRMRVGFNYREGLTIHDIWYDNRSLFYRLSLSEMFVPYGKSHGYLENHWF